MHECHAKKEKKNYKATKTSGIGTSVTEKGTEKKSVCFPKKKSLRNSGNMVSSLDDGTFRFRDQFHKHLLYSDKGATYSILKINKSFFF